MSEDSLNVEPSPQDRALVDRWFEAMRAGADGEERLLALFAEDAVYVEPFAGSSRTHSGKSAIRACFAASWEDAPPDMTLTVDRVDMDGGAVRSLWTCESPVFPGPMRGEDRYTFEDGHITRLETRFLAP